MHVNQSIEKKSPSFAKGFDLSLISMENRGPKNCQAIGVLTFENR